MGKGGDWEGVKGEESRIEEGKGIYFIYIRVGCLLKKTKEGTRSDFSCCTKHGMPFGVSTVSFFPSDFILPKMPF